MWMESFGISLGRDHLELFQAQHIAIFKQIFTEDSCGQMSLEDFSEKSGCILIKSGTDHILCHSV